MDVIFAARFIVEVDAEFDTVDAHTAANDAEGIGLALRSLIDGSALPGPGTPVVWVAGVDIDDPMMYEVTP